MFAKLALNPRNRMRQEGPESFPRVLFANSGTKRRVFMEKVGWHITQTAEIRFHDLALAVRHLSGDILNTSRKQRTDYIYKKNREQERKAERSFNDGLSYRTLNTTRTTPIRHKNGQVEMVGPTEGLLAAFSDLDGAPNRRRFMLRYITTFARLLLNEVLPETLKRSGGSGLVVGGAAAINALRNFFRGRFQDFLENSIDTLSSQAGDIFFAPQISASPIALDYSNSSEHRLFANRLSALGFARGAVSSEEGSSDLKYRAHHLDWWRASGVVPFKLTGNWLKKKYPGFRSSLREVFEPGAYGAINFTNYYYSNGYKFNKFIYDTIELASILKEKYKVDVSSAYAIAAKKTSRLLSDVAARKGASGEFYVKDKHAFKQLSVLPELRRSLKTKFSTLKRSMAKSFIFENILLRWIRGGLNKEALKPRMASRGGEETYSIAQAARLRPYALQKRNIEMRRGRDAYTFLVPKRSKF